MARRIFLLDRSGSMDSIRGDTIGGFNSFVKSQIPDGGSLSLYLFDHELECVYSDTPIEKVPLMNENTFVPRGSTALLDAMGEVIKKESGSKAIMVILTDGEENSSNKYTKEHIKDLTEMRTKEGWEFVYLGANQDAFSVGREIGATTTLNFDANKTPELFRSLGAAMSQAASAGRSINFA